MYDRFNDDNGYAGTRHEQLNFSVEDLRDPEDLRLEKGDDALIALYVRAKTAINRLSANVTAYTAKGISVPAMVRDEEVIEQWLNNAGDQLPEWADWLTA